MSAASSLSGVGKKTKTNGFAQFMFEFKKKNSIDDMNEAQMQAGRIWQDMNEDERAAYNQKAQKPESSKKPKVKYHPLTFPAFPSAVVAESVDVEKADKHTEQNLMDHSIKDLLKKNSIADLKATTFFMMACSYYYKDFTGHVFPAELGIAKFTLEDGIADELHMKIYPGQLPLGSASAAKVFSDKTHGYPLPPKSDEAIGDYTEMFSKISQFLGVDMSNKRPQYPPIFVHPGYEDFETVKHVLDTITVEAKVNIDFRVYPLEELFFRLVRMANELRPTGKPQHKNFLSIHMARAYLKNDPYSYLDIGCEYHAAVEKSEHCCLAKVKRWGGIIAKKILDDQYDKIIVGKHVPRIYGAPDKDKPLSVSSQQSIFSDSRLGMMDSSISNLSLNSHSDVEESAAASNSSSIQRILMLSRFGRQPKKA